MSQQDLTGVGEINALLGRGTTYEGKLTFDGRVRIDGHFRGTIVSDDLLILGDGAVVEADVHVGTLIVHGGRLEGSVHATTLVEIHSPGSVKGDIETPEVFIDKGVVFDGRVVMPSGDAATVHPLDESEPPPAIAGDSPAVASEPAGDDEAVVSAEAAEAAQSPDAAAAGADEAAADVSGDAGAEPSDETPDEERSEA